VRQEYPAYSPTRLPLRAALPGKGPPTCVGGPFLSFGGLPWEDWLGGGAPMWWSHADAATYRRWIAEAGLTVEREEFAPEGESGHALFWARRRA